MADQWDVAEGTHKPTILSEEKGTGVEHCSHHKGT